MAFFSNMIMYYSALKIVQNSLIFWEMSCLYAKYETASRRLAWWKDLEHNRYLTFLH